MIANVCSHTVPTHGSKRNMWYGVNTFRLWSWLSRCCWFGRLGVFTCISKGKKMKKKEPSSLTVMAWNMIANLCSHTVPTHGSKRNMWYSVNTFRLWSWLSRCRWRGQLGVFTCISKGKKMKKKEPSSLTVMAWNMIANLCSHTVPTHGSKRNMWYGVNTFRLWSWLSRCRWRGRLSVFTCISKGKKMKNKVPSSLTVMA